MASPVLYIHDEAVHNKEAARVILPITFESSIVTSVLDVGCGLGTWLSICDTLGVKDILGVDGDYVDRTKLKIQEKNFKAVDLKDKFDFKKKFDLVICLEVAEHTPLSSADVLVESLVRHGDFLLFSAAIPNQGGQNHLNEQWPEYWQKKFKKHGFYFHDIIRPKIWSNENIEWWYKQNIFVIKKTPPLSQPFDSLSVVHPELFTQKHIDQSEYHKSLVSGKQGLRLSTRIFLNSLAYAIKRFFGIAKRK